MFLVGFFSVVILGIALVDFAFRYTDNPKCVSKNSVYMPDRRVWRCRDCQKQFSVKVGSILLYLLTACT